MKTETLATPQAVEPAERTPVRSTDSQQQPAAPETGGGLAAPTLLGVRRRLENGTAIVEDEGIGVRVWLKPNGQGAAESMGARRESMLTYAGRIDAMIDEARAMLSPNAGGQPPSVSEVG